MEQEVNDFQGQHGNGKDEPLFTNSRRPVDDFVASKGSRTLGTIEFTKLASDGRNSFQRIEPRGNRRNFLPI